MVNIRGMLASEGMGACRSGKPDESYAKPLDGLLSEGIDRAVRFLFDKQTSYGEIAAYRFFNPQLAGASLLDSSPFSTTFALHALRFIDHPKVPIIRERAVRFLMEEKEGAGLWRYWTSRAGLPIDPDVDDTCCVSFELRAVFPGDDGRLANVDLVLANRDQKGMFKTWFRAAGYPNDIDYVVNANVLLYLGDRPETRAASDALVRLVHENREADASHYYVAPFALYYAIARAYDRGVLSLHACRAAILGKLAAQCKTDGSAWGDAMTTALAVCTLASYRAYDDQSIHDGIRHLLDVQQADGSFERAAFYAGPEPPAPHSVYWGSEELTTSLCLEAFGRYSLAG